MFWNRKEQDSPLIKQILRTGELRRDILNILLELHRMFPDRIEEINELFNRYNWRN